MTFSWLGCGLGSGDERGGSARAQGRSSLRRRRRLSAAETDGAESTVTGKKRVPVFPCAPNSAHAPINRETCAESAQIRIAAILREFVIPRGKDGIKNSESKQDRGRNLCRYCADSLFCRLFLYQSGSSGGCADSTFLSPFFTPFSATFLAPSSVRIQRSKMPDRRWSGL